MPRLSLAQTLPPELLSRIFGWLVEIRSGEKPNFLRANIKNLVEWPWTANIPDLRDCTLVCRRWRPQAQQMLFRSIAMREVDDKKLLNQLRIQPELAAAVRVLDIQLVSKDFVIDLESDDCASAIRRIEALCNTRLSILELCTRACHLVIGDVVPSQRERLVGILDSLPLKSLIDVEVDSSRYYPSSRGLVWLSVLELCSLAQRPTLRNLAVFSHRDEHAYTSPFVPIPGLHSHLTALSMQISHTQDARRLIAMAAATLRRLSIVSRNPLPGHIFAPIFASLSLLTELDVFVRVNIEGGETSWFSTILPKLGSLKRLAVNIHFADVSTLLAAPSKVQDLGYWTDETRRRPSAPFLRSLQAALSTSWTPLPYSTLRVPDPESSGDEVKREYAALVDVCRSRGVELQGLPGTGYHPLMRTQVSFF
ncbi:RHTO0S20e02674g1_1 [Rhodotorula toruloides]|uniref:RHTO0S20e02674g1_1 n=1 Tax=Rhodotorula toruloides TaxID=5286 RepID=A0A061BFW1_RHOTO|nr:RHTO0S20e02674g1_1 [Rhodotorula toruloides]